MSCLPLPKLAALLISSSAKRHETEIHNLLTSVLCLSRVYVDVVERKIWREIHDVKAPSVSPPLTTFSPPDHFHEVRSYCLALMSFLMRVAFLWDDRMKQKSTKQEDSDRAVRTTRSQQLSDRIWKHVRVAKILVIRKKAALSYLADKSWGKFEAQPGLSRLWTVIRLCATQSRRCIFGCDVLSSYFFPIP